MKGPFVSPPLTLLIRRKNFTRIIKLTTEDLLDRLEIWIDQSFPASLQQASGTT